MTTPDLDTGPPGTASDHGDGDEIAHAVCCLCYPDAPQIGQTAACGVAINILEATGPHCAVCEELAPMHAREHMRRGEYPL